MIIASLINTKGGSGKSTSAINIAAELAKKKRVLLIDFESRGGGDCTITFCNSNETATLNKNNPNVALTEYVERKWYKDEKKYQIDHFKKTLYDLLEGTATINEIIYPVRKNLDILPSSPDLVRFEKEKIDLNFLKRQLPNLNYDFIIIDAPGAFNNFVYAALFASTHILTPLKCTSFDLSGLSDTFNKIAVLQKNGYLKTIKFGVFPTMYDPRLENSKDAMKFLKEKYNKWLLPEIRRSTKVESFADHGQVLNEYAPNIKPTKDYADLAKVMLKWD